MASTLVLGLDLGNTTCSVAVYRAGVVEVVANPEGSRVTPACIAFTEVETLLGEPARAQLARNVANTVVDGLRLLGREYDDDDFQKELASWRFKVSKGKDGAPLVEVKLKGEAKSFTAPRLLALLLSKLRADADASTGETVKEAVVAVPAAFSEQQTAALKEAAQTGAIRVKLMLSAPLCVALLFGQTIGREATATAAAAAAAAPEVSAADCRIVASLAVRELPDGVVSLLVRVSLDTERHLELICEAALGGDAEEGEGGGSLRTVSLASVKA